MKKKATPSTKKTVSKSSPLLSPLPNSSSKKTKKQFEKYNFEFPSAKAGSVSPLLNPATTSKMPLKISDLRDLARSEIDEMKKLLDLSHSEVMKEVEGSKSRISKRYKMQTQVCMQLTEQVERDYKKISDRINENSEVMKESYAKIISEVQASTSRVVKVRIPELAQSVEKSIEALRSRYKIAGAPTSLKYSLNAAQAGYKHTK